MTPPNVQAAKYVPEKSSIFFCAAARASPFVAIVKKVLSERWD